MASEDQYLLKDHQQWLGYLQPEGLVVSAQVLVDSQVFINRHSAPLQEKLREIVDDPDGTPSVELLPLLTGFLEWPEDLLAGTEAGGPIPEELTVPLPEYGETLEPTYAVRQPSKKGEWVLLVKQVHGELDEKDHTEWGVSHAQRFERLLRDTRVPIGLVSNGRLIRLVYAPRGENSGSLTFTLAQMMEPAGRPMVAAFDELLRASRLFSVPTEARLPALLSKSRDYQASVSETLAGQVLEALYELTRGFQAADAKVHGKLLGQLADSRPEHIYEGMLTVLLRMVFIAFAEDRALLPTSGLYSENYSLHGLFHRLRRDAEIYPDTMDSRYGGWSQLLALFRAIHDGCQHPEMQMPARKGYLFAPDRFPFLEGRTMEEPSVPLLADGTLHRVLSKLLVLKGERLSYRTLDVEQIGGVYETMMGFQLLRATGLTVSLKAPKRNGAPAAVDLGALLAIKGADRAKWLAENADTKISGEAASALKSATTIEDILSALDKRIARGATPHPVPKGSLILQPSEERRRSGSHYTPRSLTEPVVRKALAPVLAKLGVNPTPDAILALKVADIAVGSGAFLVETCRQLGDVLVPAWRHHKCLPQIPPDEDEVLLAKRVIAQSCLYGVDRNPMAVDLAKLSLWLSTLAKDHPFTFLDHAIRHGDSLVGLTRQQIAGFSWGNEGPVQFVFGQKDLGGLIAAANKERQKIVAAQDRVPPDEKTEHLEKADAALKLVRLAGDYCIHAFFSESKDKARNGRRERAAAEFSGAVANDRAGEPTLLAEIEASVSALAEGRGGHPVRPFHWEIEFPEVFESGRGGFDCIVGNPPFAGKNTLIAGNHEHYPDWLQTAHPKSHGNADLVAHFFRRAFSLLRPDGTFGLIATNTIRQGDTRHTGLRWICTEGGGTIYSARRRFKWPGAAAVVVSIVWVAKGAVPGPFDLDGVPASIITAYLFHDGGHDSPDTLAGNAGKSFIGSYVLGMGFTFDDTDTKGIASPIAEMHRLIARDPRNAERIFPYLGGEEVNDSPTHSHHRYVINFADYPLRREPSLSPRWSDADEAQRTTWLRDGIVPRDYPGSVAADWPELLGIVERKVKPERLVQKDRTGQMRWWNFLRTRGEMLTATRDLDRVVSRARIGNAFAFTFLPSRIVMNEKTVVFPFNRFAPFAALQSRVHELWAVFFSSTLKDDLQYTPSDCFETFPFPECWESSPDLENAGKEYYDFRADLMVRNNEGLTKTYNRFHDPEEASSDILKLRELHAKMDEAVLRAYGWEDLIPECTCEFLLDYEEDDDGQEGQSRRRKKPYRFRWRDEVRDEVLARLLKLNAERAEQEKLDAAGAVPVKGKRRKASHEAQQSLF